jgi:heme O synthase-like polyprenyltransferase
VNIRTGELNRIAAQLPFINFLLSYGHSMLNATTQSSLPKWRTLLVLGRVSNLPTVWSNCLAGWILGGGGEIWKLLWLCVAATFLYVGGMYLNDACDAEFDRKHRPERPIPSGAIAENDVWALGVGWLGLGTAMLVLFGKQTAIFTLLLTGFILLYDTVHKTVSFSPAIMAACRFFLLLVAASTGLTGVSGLALWSAVVLAAYVVGLSYIARHESTHATLRHWPVVFLAAPIVLALVANGEEYRQRAIVLSLVVGLWILRSLRPALWSAQPNYGKTVSALLAGIVLVDCLAVLGGGTAEFTTVFVMLFAAALLFQRYVPAT